MSTVHVCLYFVGIISCIFLHSERNESDHWLLNYVKTQWVPLKIYWTCLGEIYHVFQYLFANPTSYLLDVFLANTSDLQHLYLADQCSRQWLCKIDTHTSSIASVFIADIGKHTSVQHLLQYISQHVFLGWLSIVIKDCGLFWPYRAKSVVICFTPCVSWLPL